MKITKVELWNDTGFVDGAAEVPSMTDVLPTADITITDELRPTKDELFSRLKISSIKEQTEGTTVFWAFEDLVNVSYVAIKYDRLDYTIYGWVDNVLMISDSPTPVTAIDWHIDYWRTFISSAKFGYGLVQKRPRSAVDPIQKVPCRYRLAGEFHELTSSVIGSDNFWIMINTTSHINKDGSKVSIPRTMIVPVDKKGVNTVYLSPSSDDKIGKACPTLKDFVSGSYDEILGISPDIISSVFIYPFPPMFITAGSGIAGDAYIIETTSGTSEDWVTETGRVDFRRAYSVSTSYNKIDVAYSDGTSTSYSEGSARGTVEAFVEGAVAVCGGYGHSITLKITSSGSYQVNVASELPVIKLDDMMKAKSVSKDAKLSLFGHKGVYTDGSINLTQTTSSYNVTFTGTASSVTEFAYDGTTWGDYWIAYDPDDIPTYELKTKTVKDQVSQGVDSCDGVHVYAFTDTAKYQEITFSCSVETTDTSEAVLLDFDGNPVFTSPWGRKFTMCTIRPVITMTSGVMEIRFDGQDSRADGTCASVPLPQVDITSNAWSAYLFSGQREYDITQRKLAAKQALVSAVTSTFGSSFQTGVLGGVGRGGVSDEQIASLQSMMLRQYRGEKGFSTISGIVGSGGGSTALRSGTGMMGMGLAGAGVDYLTTRYFNGKLQDTEDTLKAKQNEALITAGSGWDWLFYGRMPGFVTLVPDDYSLKVFQDSVSLGGITVSEPTSDCTSLVKAGGPLQITNLIVTGSIPVQAKNYIANKIANGVRIK